MLNKNDLIKTYLLTSKSDKGSNLYIQGNALINYETCIALKKDGIVFLNAKKYSTTTSRNQNLIRKECSNYGLTLCECSDEQIYKMWINMEA